MNLFALTVRLYLRPLGWVTSGEPLGLCLLGGFLAARVLRIHPISFSSREFSAALASCGACTCPGLDGIEYRVVRGLSSFSLEFLLAVYNRMFRESSFPESWRNTLVVFIPKTGTGKFRPISLTSVLCKLFERLVQRRVEYMAEHGDWIPPN